jgi:hypothetical protein
MISLLHFFYGLNPKVSPPPPRPIATLPRAVRGAWQLKPYHLNLVPGDALVVRLRACVPRATVGVLVPSAQGPASSIGRHPVERVGEAPGFEPGSPTTSPWLGLGGSTLLGAMGARSSSWSECPHLVPYKIGGVGVAWICVLFVPRNISVGAPIDAGCCPFSLGGFSTLTAPACIFATLSHNFNSPHGPSSPSCMTLRTSPG